VVVQPAQDRFDLSVRSPRTSIAGFELDLVTEAEVLTHVDRAWQVGSGGWILTVNTDILRRVARDEEYAALVADASIRVIDGVPLLWAARLAGRPAPSRVTGADMLWTLSELAAIRRRSIFLIGGNPGTAAATATRLASAHPRLRVAGIEVPDTGFEQDLRYLEQLDILIQESSADLIYVALGSPRQDRVIARLRHVLPEAWFIGVGAAFSFAAGDVSRAPMWMQRAGLEWTHRLVQEPRRLARRYIVQDAPFALRLLTQTAIKRVVV
jgi:exopolysaccharide biosynthesis WecB/TagA/CpsF family protein